MDRHGIWHEKIYQVYTKCNFFNFGYTRYIQIYLFWKKDMTWIWHGYDILLKNIPDVVISMSYPWDMTKNGGFVIGYGFPDAGGRRHRVARIKEKIDLPVIFFTDCSRVTGRRLDKDRPRRDRGWGSTLTTWNHDLGASGAAPGTAVIVTMTHDHDSALGCIQVSPSHGSLTLWLSPLTRTPTEAQPSASLAGLQVQ